MDDAQFLRCQDIIARRMGYSWRRQDVEAVRRTLDERVRALRLATVEEYVAILCGSSAQAENEWKTLFSLLTNQESYFFRDQGHFDALRGIVLPELIRKNQKFRTLRIWSAGCSTGEEPYSLAILVSQLLPLRENWHVTIMGTDLSEKALEKARQGVYGAWSFRAMDDELRRQYFVPRGSQFALVDEIRAMVTFRHGNLISDNLPEAKSGLIDLDLILCRNVFIYFKREAVAQVVEKFARTLSTGGFLLTGHAELHDVSIRDLETRQYSHATFLRKNPDFQDVSEPARNERPTGRTAPSHPPRQTISVKPIALPERAPVPAAANREAVLESARRHLRRGAARQALSELESLTGPDSKDVVALCLAARAFADCGDYEKSLILCQRGRQLDSFSALPFHVMASVAEERGDYSEAKDMLKKVLYLAPEYVFPYIELSAIYRREGDLDRTRTMHRAALDLLKGLRPDQPAPVDPLGLETPVLAGQLLTELEANRL